MSNPSGKFAGTSAIPDDDPRRALVIARPDADASLEHLALVGDTTILLRGEDTAGRYCLIDMHIPPEGGRGGGIGRKLCALSWQEISDI